MDTSADFSDMRLTPRQAELLRAAAYFQASRCYSPTISELADELSISRSTAFEHLAELQRKGLLQTSPGKARSLKLTSSGQELLSRLDNAGGSVERSPDGIPLVGVVAAGEPIEAVENGQTLSLSSYFGISDDLFALEVRGDSMIDDDIRHGDYVICRRTPVAADGQLVVAIVDDCNATLKRFYKERSCVRLEPANEQYEPIYSGNCRIEGVVVGLMRRL
jgi:repressor LexA